MTQTDPRFCPGLPEAMAALDGNELGLYGSREIATVILRAATPAILAAALADLADACEEDGYFGPELPLYLDTMSAQIRERTSNA